MSNTYPFTAEKLASGHPDGSGYVPIGQVFEAPSGEPILVSMMIPDETTYHSEVLRLSRKATRGGPYTKPEWSDASSMAIKYRSKAMRLLGGASLTIREAHNASLPPTESLQEVQTIQQLPSPSGIEGAEAVQIIAYDVGSKVMKVVEIDTYTRDNEKQMLHQELAKGALLGTTNPEEKHWINFYLFLLNGAGEKANQAPALSRAEIEQARQAWLAKRPRRR